MDISMPHHRTALTRSTLSGDDVSPGRHKKTDLDRGDFQVGPVTRHAKVGGLVAPG